MAEPRIVTDSSEKGGGTDAPAEENLLTAGTVEEAFRERIRTELVRELVRHPLDALPRNRWLVNELYRRLLGTEPLDAEDLCDFLRAAAAVMREEVLDRARRARGQPNDTVADADPSGSHSTLAMTRTPSDISKHSTSLSLAENSPETVRARIAHWDALFCDPDPIQQQLADLYALADFAGRTPEELADLFDRSLVELRAELCLAEFLIRGQNSPSVLEAGSQIE